jgi:hypothetical protein
VEPVRLDLVPPADRGLGPALVRNPLPELGPAWQLAGWEGISTLYLVVRQGLLVGWVEYGVNGMDRWIAVADNSYLVDEHTGQPLWHTSAGHAARTVQLASQQDVR